MTIFNERERALEEKFKRDQDLRFRVHARRNRHIGLWAAAEMRLNTEETEAYAQSLVAFDVQKFHDAEIVQKLVKDLAAKGARIGEAEVRREMERQLSIAHEQLTPQS